jgi:hypothetical protein
MVESTMDGAATGACPAKVLRYTLNQQFGSKWLAPRLQDKFGHYFTEAIVKRIAATLVMFALLGLWDAKAQQFDLSTMTCDSFLKGDKDQMKLITAWLAGYYTDESAAEVVDMSALNKRQDELVKFCIRETDFPIASAADGIFGDAADTSGSSSGTGQSGH